MALQACSECGKEMAQAADTCPHCGNPNAAMQKKKRNSGQSMGCLLFLLAIPLALFAPVLGGLLALVGLIVVAANTRLW